MTKWLVRMNCEYSIEIEAETKEAAIKQAGATDLEEWPIQAWSTMEADDPRNIWDGWPPDLRKPG